MATRHNNGLIELEEPDFQTDDMEIIRVGGIDYWDIGSGSIAQCVALNLQSEYGFKCIRSGDNWLVHHPTDMDRMRIAILIEMD